MRLIPLLWDTFGCTRTDILWLLSRSQVDVKMTIYCASCLISRAIQLFPCQKHHLHKFHFLAQERPQRKWLNFTEQKEVDLWDCFALWDSMQALWLYWPYQLTWAMPNLRAIEKHTLMHLMLATFKRVGPVPHTAVGIETLTVQVCLPAHAYLNVLLKIDILEPTLLFMTILSLLIIN